MGWHLWRRIWSPRLKRRRRRNRAVVIVLALLLAIGAAALVANLNVVVAEAAFAAARANQTELRNFLYRMPKGGDLHVHLSGGVYAERYIGWAADDDLFLLSCNMTIVKLPLDKPPAPPCDKADDFLPMKKVAQDQTLSDRVVNAMSMRDFVPTGAEPSGHDHFFAAFGKFGAVSGRHFDDMVVDQLAYYGDQSAQYVELMTSFSGFDERKQLVGAIAGKTDFAAKLEALTEAGLATFVEQKKQELDKAVAEIEKKRDCNPQKVKPGCNVTYRFVAQVSRNSPPDDVFVQTAIAAALVRADSRVVAFNYVQVEDAAIARADYHEQMRIVAYLAGNPPDEKRVDVTLHAGELWLGLVPPDDLTFHIGEAVKVALAQRIGHGVSLAFERDRDGLLAEMHRRNVAVEINLTSNDMILGVRGNIHPFPAYRAAGVPVVLTTDDAGVERIDLTDEYVRAALDYRIDYTALKALARASLTYSFLEKAEKEAELARFDAASAEFERSVAARISLPQKLALIARASAGWW
jgi:adenosine deaminase